MEVVRYPLFLDLTGRRVVVIGGGAVATRRVADLFAAGARVVVVAPAVAAEISAFDVEVRVRPYSDGDLAEAWLVLACTDDPRLNAAIAGAAEALGIWCIRADDAAGSAAWRPASTAVDDLTVAVSAGGDPGRAAELRDVIGNALRSGALAPRRHRPADGRVTLVGGGPGDPDLLTLRGMRALLDADVVVTDRLAPTGLLDSLSAEVEVVPGVTSATAAAALAGIALTERGTTQQFVVASGHVPPGDERSTVDWGTLGATDATLVLLMAVGNLAPIAETLIAGGRSADCGAAIVENASLPSQRVVRGRLAEIAEIAERESFVPPAVVIVGKVVRLP